MNRRDRILAARPDTAALIQACATGDQNAWSALVQQFSPQVWGVVRRHGLSWDDSQDVCQRTWLRVVERLPKGLPGPEHFAAWLNRTTRGECLDHIKGASQDLPLRHDPAAEHASGPDAPEPFTVGLPNPDGVRLPLFAPRGPAAEPGRPDPLPARTLPRRFAGPERQASRPHAALTDARRLP